MRRNRIGSFAAIAVFLACGGVAHAGPMTWGPDVYDPASDIYFGNGGAACTAESLSASCDSLLYGHDLTLYGFVPGASSPDQLTGGVLDIVLRDDADDAPRESFKIALEGLLQPGTADAAWPVSFNTMSGAVLLSLQLDSVLNVLLTRQNGDFVFETSTFTAYGTHAASGPAAVPEPALTFLLGMGALAGGGGLTRRRRSRMWRN